MHTSLRPLLDHVATMLRRHRKPVANHLDVDALLVHAVVALADDASEEEFRDLARLYAAFDESCGSSRAYYVWNGSGEWSLRRLRITRAAAANLLDACAASAYDEGRFKSR